MQIMQYNQKKNLTPLFVCMYELNNTASLIDRYLLSNTSRVHSSLVERHNIHYLATHLNLYSNGSEIGEIGIVSSRFGGEEGEASVGEEFW